MRLTNLRQDEILSNAAGPERGRGVLVAVLNVGERERADGSRSQRMWLDIGPAGESQVEPDYASGAAVLRQASVASLAVALGRRKDYSGAGHWPFHGALSSCSSEQTAGESFFALSRQARRGHFHGDVCLSNSCWEVNHYGSL